MPATFHGVDFGGAKRAGRNIWIATLQPTGDGQPGLSLVGLASLERLCGTDERASALTVVSYSRLMAGKLDHSASDHT
jgi:hypothetical protein